MVSHRRRLGPEALGPYIISMAQGADDALAVLLLARIAQAARRNVAGAKRLASLPVHHGQEGVRGWHGDAEASTAADAADNADPDADASALDVAPLFETVPDLRSAAETLAEMLAEPTYRAHLKRRGDVQHVMLGYSDSSKESGVLASRFALQRAQRELLRVAGDHGLRLQLFHGRGGTASRGGSKIREAVLAEPEGAVDGFLRLTEQGELISRQVWLAPGGPAHPRADGRRRARGQPRP